MSEPKTVDPFPSGKASYRVLETYARNVEPKHLQDLKKRLNSALDNFPELSTETITVGLLYPGAKDSINGRAHSWNRLICFPSDEYVSNVTLYHELGHVAIRVTNEQGGYLPKTSEEFCSIFSMARMPPHAVDEQRVPYLGKSPKATEKFPEICADALEYREEKRNYIQKCKEWLEI